jgi:hypothetical protein
MVLWGNLLILHRKLIDTYGRDLQYTVRFGLGLVVLLLGRRRFLPRG